MAARKKNPIILIHTKVQHKNLDNLKNLKKIFLLDFQKRNFKCVSWKCDFHVQSVTKDALSPNNMFTFMYYWSTTIDVMLWALWTICLNIWKCLKFYSYFLKLTCKKIWKMLTLKILFGTSMETFIEWLRLYFITFWALKIISLLQYIERTLNIFIVIFW